MSFLGVHAGLSEWHGVGVVAGLLVVALLAWEAGRVLGVKAELGGATPGLVSVVLALLLVLFTLVTFLTHNEPRHWPAWIGLLLSLAIGAAAVSRARAEGVQMPSLQTGSAAPAAAPPAADPQEPPPAGESQPDA